VKLYVAMMGRLNSRMLGMLKRISIVVVASSYPASLKSLKSMEQSFSYCCPVCLRETCTLRCCQSSS